VDYLDCGVLLQRLLTAPGQPGHCTQAPRDQQTALLAGKEKQIAIVRLKKIVDFSCLSSSRKSTLCLFMKTLFTRTSWGNKDKFYRLKEPVLTLIGGETCLGWRGFVPGGRHTHTSHVRSKVNWHSHELGPHRRTPKPRPGPGSPG
jgi:hypothetical protein